MQQTQWIVTEPSDPAMQMIRLQQLQWSALKQLYRQQMPYSKPTLKDKIAIISSDNQVSAEMHHSGDTNASTDVNRPRANNIIAAIRIKPVGQWQLITGLVVSSEHRGQGLAHKLLEFITPELQANDCYVFALPHLSHFYQQHGFVKVQLAVNDIQQLYLKHHLAQKPLVLMRRQTL